MITSKQEEIVQFNWQIVYKDNPMWDNLTWMGEEIPVLDSDIKEFLEITKTHYLHTVSIINEFSIPGATNVTLYAFKI